MKVMVLVMNDDILWCEDCFFYKSYGLGAEGECLQGFPDIFYASPPCDLFLLRVESASNGNNK